MQKLWQFWCSKKAAAVLPRIGADVIVYYRSRAVLPRLLSGSTAPDQKLVPSLAVVGPVVFFLVVPLASNSTATICGSTVRSSGSTAPMVLLAFCLLAVVFQRGTSALAVVPLCAGCEHNGWIFPHL